MLWCSHVHTFHYVMLLCTWTGCVASSISFKGTWKNSIELVSQSDGAFRHLCKLTGHKGGITTMAFSLDGLRLYSGARKDKEIICWDLRVRTFPTTTHKIFKPPWRKKVTDHFPLLEVLILFWFQVPGRPVFCVNRESNTNQKISIDLSTCGKWLVSGGTDGKVQVWNVAENGPPSVHMQVSFVSNNSKCGAVLSIVFKKFECVNLQVS